MNAIRQFMSSHRPAVVLLTGAILTPIADGFKEHRIDWGVVAYSALVAVGTLLKSPIGAQNSGQ